MQVKFRTNLGSIDAGKLKIDWTKCKLGDVLDVETSVGETLVRSGIAEEIPAKPLPEKIKAVPKAPEVGAAK